MGKVTGMVSNLLYLLPLFGLFGTVGDWALRIYTLWIAFRFSNQNHKRTITYPNPVFKIEKHLLQWISLYGIFSL